MKKMKLFAATAMMAMVATAGYFGYTAYKQANMTDAERMMQANLEALTSGEDSSGGTCLLNPVFCMGWGASACIGGTCTYQSNISAPLNNPTYGSCN